MAKTVRSRARAAAQGAGNALKKVPGPSPNPMTNLVVADLVLRGSGRLMRRTVEQLLLQSKYDQGVARRIIKGRGLTKTLISTAIARIATTSVPGALAVGGGLLAKTLYDRKQGRSQARRAGTEAIAEQAAKGSDRE